MQAIAFILTILLSTAAHSWEAKEWGCSNLDGATKEVEVKTSPSQIFVDIEDKEEKVLTIQVKHNGGSFLIANEKRKTDYPFRGGVIEKASSLILYPIDSQGLLQHHGDVYALRCYRL